jgi:hypothetical protein
MEARVAFGPTYTPMDPFVIAGAHFDVPGTDPRRYDILLGIDTEGDTAVVLPDSIGGGGPFIAPGVSTTVPGIALHTYQLVLDPATKTADLFIDGSSLPTLEDYAGHTSFAGDGLYFGAASGGQGRFAHVSVIPEPSSMLLCGLLALHAAGYRWIRRRAPTDGTFPCWQSESYRIDAAL